MTVRELIERQAALRPDAIYCIATEDGQRIAYGELARSCRRVAALLQSHGVRRGDTVSVVMPNGLNTVRILLGALHAGCCVNPVNLLSQPTQMSYVLAHSDCRAVCTAPEWEARVREMVAELDRDVAVLVVAPDGKDVGATATPVGETPPPSGDAIALLMYT